MDFVYTDMLHQDCILSQSIMKNRNVFVTNQSGKCGKEHTNCEKSMLKGQIINAMFSEVEGIQ